jgi:hypothetical protein
MADIKEETIERSIKAKTFRFKFSEKICDLLLDFSQQYKFDSADDFKENWNVWTSENHDEICNEQQRLEALGYVGNILTKMYKSVRYYYCKKHMKHTDVQDKRRKYISTNKNFIELIDMFIKRQCDNQSHADYIIFNCKPSDGWKTFQELFDKQINDEILRVIYENNFISQDDALIKIKKTFNNRYFINIRSQTC